MIKKLSIRLIASFIGAGVIWFLCHSNLLLGFSNALNDAVYQREVLPHEDIVIIGIDERALEEFGQWPWSREIIAEAVAYLNSDSEAMPAIIGIDTVFDAPTTNEEDALFAEVLGREGNVVVGTFAIFGSALVTNEDGSFYLDDYAVMGYEESYDELKENVMQGHVNAMLDSDGVLRHAIWEIELQDGTVVPAFYRVIAEEYSKITGTPIPEKPPTDSRGRWYVVQQTLPGGYSDGVSISDLVDGSVPSQFFKDKIVLIGPYATGLQDEYKTPIAPAQTMFGVEYQANAIGALLSNNTKAEPISAQNTTIFALAFICFFLLYRQRFFRATIFWLVGVAVWFIGCEIMFRLGFIIHILYGLIAISVPYFFAVILNYFRELSERQRVSFTFRRYVAPEIVSELLKDNPRKLALGGRTAEISVLFADIRGFTSLSSILPAPKVVEILNRILSVSSDAVLHNRGTLDKYIGDCTMAFWGAPLSQRDHQYNAVKTALQISEQIALLSKELEEQYGHRLGCGIGVCSGSAVVGNIGSASRMDYTVIGNTVNTASRLEGLAGSGKVYVNKSLAEALKGRVEFVYLGNDFAIKGLSEDFEVYEAVRLID